MYQSIDHFSNKLISSSLGLVRTKSLNYLLGSKVHYEVGFLSNMRKSTIVCWGLKPSSIRAEAWSLKYGLPLLRIEDGFLRSVNAGSDEPPLSIVLDDLGIYYDCSKPSRLEELIKHPLTTDQSLRSNALIKLWRGSRVSKYNHSPDPSSPTYQKYVLVADQTFGDLSIRYGQADTNSFNRMLTAALQENPDCQILLKVHPDVVLGKKSGHFDFQFLINTPRVTVLSDAIHPVCLIEHAQAIYCVTSQLGFEALLWGKPVRTFGMPFYAGWGLTQDDLPRPERRYTVALENLVYAALIAYPRYLDPETFRRCEVERLVEWMALQRKMRGRFPAVLEASGFSFYKKPIVRRFFQGSRVYFDRKSNEWAENAPQILWGKRPAAITSSDDRNVIRLEDGFIRSVGLGADLVSPVSWAMDTRGIYYDASQPSDLEVILQESNFTDSLLARARQIRERLVSEKVSKYNVGSAVWRRTDVVGKVADVLILVPGQVETDASIAYGAPGVASNIVLLKAVRLANPNAFIIYKPHPDVVAGLRKKGQDEANAGDFCDLVLVDLDMAYLLDQVDEVHTMTSLTGFEALLRGKVVVCYGLPFYAGWGLTEDLLPLPRRSRQLTLDELVAGALLIYPTYISRTTGKFTTPERALDELLMWRQKSPAQLPWWRLLLRTYLRLEAWVVGCLNGSLR